MNNLPIQSLWIGRSLSALECMSKNSFPKHGPEYHLHCYEEIENIPPDIEAEYIISSEYSLKDNKHITSSNVIKAPQNSAIMDNYFSLSSTYDPNQLKWGETGPRLMGSAVEKYDLKSFVTLPQVFCPVDF